MKYITVLLVLVLASCGASAQQAGRVVPVSVSKGSGTSDGQSDGAVAVLGGGCFWCLEAAYEIVPGVLDVESGYAGGEWGNPTYEQVGAGLTGHAEVVRIVYDPAVISYDSLLDLFFRIHDPTTKNRQGADVGTQYRSIILYATDEQKKAAEGCIASIGPSYKNPVVTELQRLDKYWPAEDYHQDFFRKNPEYGYCQVVVVPKVDKARKFVDAIKTP
jgi:peptide-methionine (S)-S-oxide reductase